MVNKNGIIIMVKVLKRLMMMAHKDFLVPITNDNGFIISGTYEDFNKGYLIKTNSFGNITSTFETPFTNTNNKLNKNNKLKRSRN